MVIYHHLCPSPVRVMSSTRRVWLCAECWSFSLKGYWSLDTRRRKLVDRRNLLHGMALWYRRCHCGGRPVATRESGCRCCAHRLCTEGHTLISQPALVNKVAGRDCIPTSIHRSRSTAGSEVMSWRRVPTSRCRIFWLRGPQHCQNPDPERWLLSQSCCAGGVVHGPQDR